MYSQAVLWVTNYPAEFDEAKLRELFSEVCGLVAHTNLQFGHVKAIRLPSLVFNTRRRFAYVQFETSVELAWMILTVLGRSARRFGRRWKEN